MPIKGREVAMLPMSYNDPFGLFGDMPEIPVDEIRKMSDEEFHAIGCLYSFIGMSAILVGFGIAIIVIQILLSS